MKKIPEIAKSRLSYDKATGVITWSYKNKMHPNIEGKEAGCVCSGYRVIKLNSIPFKAHRIAWFLETNKQPVFIDNINGNKLDNRFSNLRNVTHFENMKNHGKKTNSSGLPCGVRVLKNGRYQARITCNKKSYNLGVFDTPTLASNEYLHKRQFLFKQYSRG